MHEMLSRMNDSLPACFTLNELLEKLLQAARQTAQEGEAPIVSLICERAPEKKEAYAENKPAQCSKASLGLESFHLLALCSNSILKKKDPTAHSEVLAIREVCALKQRERLTDCILISTLEPCLMCSGAIVLARLKQVYYLCSRDKEIGLSWLLEHSKNTKSAFNHYPQMIHCEQYDARYRKILQTFFQERRKAALLHKQQQA